MLLGREFAYFFVRFPVNPYIQYTLVYVWLIRHDCNVLQVFYTVKQKVSFSVFL